MKVWGLLCFSHSPITSKGCRSAFVLMVAINCRPAKFYVARSTSFPFSLICSEISQSLVNSFSTNNNLQSIIHHVGGAITKNYYRIAKSSLLAWNSFENPPLRRCVSVLAEINLSRRNYQSSEFKGSSKTNLGAANDIDSPGSSGVVGRIPNTEKGGKYEQENVACDVNSELTCIHRRWA